MNKKIIVFVILFIVINVFFFLFLKPKGTTKSTFLPAFLQESTQESKSSQGLPIEQGQEPGEANQPDESETPVGQEEPLPPSSTKASFTVSGNLIGDGNPWKVLYDDPQTGAVAASFDLVFTDQSRCDFGQGETSCQPMLFEVGTQIEVTGNKDGNRLVVIKLKRAVSFIVQ